MNKVFIGGSRHISRLSAAVRVRLDTIIKKGLPMIVGDANGVDKAIQSYLSFKNYNKVEVFCSGSECRNNIGHWQTRQIGVTTRNGGRAFYTAKDRAMAHEADFGFMIWDGKSKGTLLNVFRLLKQGKKVVVYSTSEQRFAELRTFDQWGHFIAHYGPELRLDTEKEAELEEREDANRQSPLLLSLTSG